MTYITRLVLTLCSTHFAGRVVDYRLESGRYELIKPVAAQILVFNMQSQQLNVTLPARCNDSARR